MDHFPGTFYWQEKCVSGNPTLASKRGFQQIFGQEKQAPTDFSGLFLCLSSGNKYTAVQHYSTPMHYMDIYLKLDIDIHVTESYIYQKQKSMNIYMKENTMFMPICLCVCSFRNSRLQPLIECHHAFNVISNCSCSSLILIKKIYSIFLS